MVPALLYETVMIETFMNVLNEPAPLFAVITRFSFNYTIFQHQHVHLRAQVTVQGFFRRIYDGLVLVERSVQKDRNTCFFPESLNEAVIPGRNRFINGLQPACSIYVGYSGNGALFLFFYRKNFFHE